MYALRYYVSFYVCIYVCMCVPCYSVPLFKNGFPLYQKLTLKECVSVSESVVRLPLQLSSYYKNYSIKFIHTANILYCGTTRLNVADV